MQSAFFLCSLLDASRLGPSPWGASKHSEEMKNHVEVPRLLFGNFTECDPLGFDSSAAEQNWEHFSDTGIRRAVAPTVGKQHDRNNQHVPASCSKSLQHRQRQDVCLTTEFYNEMPT